MIDEPEDDEGELPPRRKNHEAESRRAWGSWQQDLEQNRRKVLRSLVGFVIVVIATGLLAYGCDLLRGPQQVRLKDEVAGYLLEPPTPETEQLAGRLEAAGGVGAAARYYRGPSDVLLMAGFSTELPVDAVKDLLPRVASDDIDYEGRNGPLTCGTTAEGSRCVWKSSDIVGGTAARGVPPQELERITRDLRAGAIKG